MNSKTENAITRIQELQLAFSDNLKSRIDELCLATLDLDAHLPSNSIHNAEHLKNTHDLAHKLAGSAGTFQFNEVYAASKKLERFCHTLLEDKTPPVEDWRTQIEQLLSSTKSASKHTSQSLYENQTSQQTDTRSLALSDTLSTTNKILLVDDDELLTALIQEQAKHFGYQITCINNPEQLPLFLEENNPEVILMDIVFPHYDFTGIDLIKRLKAENKIACPVIFLSNREDFSARLEAVRSGGNGYIVKPIKVLELVEVLNQYTHKSINDSHRVLIIDNDPTISDHYKKLLTSHNFITQTISNPLVATEALSTFLPDLILLDIHMPDCSGFEVAEVIRQDIRFTHIPILFLTAGTNNLSQYELDSFKSGGDSFMSKNTNQESLLANIISHSQRSRELYTIMHRLKQDELRFQAVSHSSSDAIISLNTEGNIILWNEGAENIFGYRSLEVIGQSIEIIIPPKHRHKHRNGFLNLLHNTKKLSKQSIESEAITKNKGLIAIELTYTAWISGSERFFTSIIRDISHRKTVENELKSQQDYLSAIIKNSAEGIITISACGTIEMANPKALTIFGYTADELHGQNISILMAQELRHQHDEYLDKSELHANKIINKARELEGLRKDGTLFPMELNVSPMNINGIKKFVGILRDITERQNTLAEITVAKRDAEDANKAKSQFLSSMSHELRTPLNAILGFTQLLQEDSEVPATAEQQECLSHIFSAGDHLLNLINEILDLSRIESGNIEVQLEAVNLTKAIERAIDLISPQAIAAQISIEQQQLEIGENFVTADSSRLNQVLVNLLTNAIKYNKKQGSIRIWLSKDIHKIRINIKDQGLGIPDNLMPSLFLPFNRLGAENSNIEGTGIGLTITKMLVEMMAGSINVESTEGEGCTFSIELEKATPADTLSGLSLLASQTQAEKPTPCQVSILYIEDNSANRLLMKKIITRNPDFTYSEAHNGADGITSALENNPDIILLDINLPDISGFEVLKALQEHDTETSSKVIFVSANAMPQDISQGQDLGAAAYITKPIDHQQLFSTIYHTLKSI